MTAGDTYDVAAEREGAEELQLSGSLSLNYVGKVRCDTVNQEEGRACRMWTAVYTMHLAMAARDIQPQPSEVTKVEAFPLSAVVAAVRGKTPLKCRNGETVEFADNFAPVIELLSDREGG